MNRAEGYLRTVRRGLEDAPPEDRERLMKRLTEAVFAYLEEDPEAGEPDLIKVFGTPEDCAAELLEECDPARVAAVRRKRRAQLYAVIAVRVGLAVAAAAALFLGGGTAAPWMDSFSHGGHSSHGSGHHG